MKSIFIGSVMLSEALLTKMLNIGFDIHGVITKKQSSFNSDHTDLANIADKYNIPVLHTTDINSRSSVEWITEIDPDVIFCFGWSQLLKNEVLNIPRFGVIGYHPSKLPENRGRHPLIWAVALGLNETASTFFYIDEGVDSGDIISQETFSILFEDYAKDVYEKMIHTASNQIKDVICHLSSNKPTIPNTSLGKANTWRKRQKSDGLIDFRMSSINIYNLIRALSEPYIGAHLVYNNKEIKVWKSIPTSCGSNNIEPGKVIEINNHQIKIKTGDSAIWLIKHEFHELPEINSYL